MLHAVQIIVSCRTETIAKEQFESIRSQEGYIGGRHYYCGPDFPWKVQAFFNAEGISKDTRLPDGCLYVSIPDGVKQSLGIPGGHSEI